MLRKTALIGVLAILIGSIGSLASIGFVYLISLVSDLFMIGDTNRLNVESSIWLIGLLILVPALGGLLVGVLCQDHQDSRPLTLMDTIRSAQGMRFDTPLKKSLKTAIAGIVAIGSGASVGQYGPLAHLGSSLGLMVRNLTGSTEFTSSMALGCGVAAAISTAFNAPIAGLVFAHEVILRHYSLRAFAPITVSAVLGYIFANYVFGRPPIFHVISLDHINPPEFLIFILIGITGAYLATMMVKATLYAGTLSARLPVSPVFKPAVAGAVVGLMAIWVPEILGMGEPIMKSILVGNDLMPISEMMMILIVKLIATAICLGFGMAGGIFSPALFVGILFGAVAGDFSASLLDEGFSSITPYVVCGMVAVASPVIGAPLTVILLVFELARNYDLAVAAMISAVFANLVGYQMMGRSIFDIQLKFQGFDLSVGRVKAIMDSRGISDYLSDQYISVNGDDSLGELKERLIDNKASDGFIIDHQGRYLGLLTLADILMIEKNNVFLDEQCYTHLSSDGLCFFYDMTIWSAMEQVQDFVGESVPVLSDDDQRKLMGVVFESSIVKAYMSSVKNIRGDEHGLG